jgi:hypothetical protein
MKYQRHLLLLALLLPAAAMAQMQGMDMPEQFAFGQPARNLLPHGPSMLKPPTPCG